MNVTKSIVESVIRSSTANEAFTNGPLKEAVDSMNSNEHKKFVYSLPREIDIQNADFNPVVVNSSRSKILDKEDVIIWVYLDTVSSLYYVGGVTFGRVVRYSARLGSVTNRESNTFDIEEKFSNLNWSTRVESVFETYKIDNKGNDKSKLVDARRAQKVDSDASFASDNYRSRVALLDTLKVYDEYDKSGYRNNASNKIYKLVKEKASTNYDFKQQLAMYDNINKDAAAQLSSDLAKLRDADDPNRFKDLIYEYNRLFNDMYHELSYIFQFDYSKDKDTDIRQAKAHMNASLYKFRHRLEQLRLK